MSSLSMRAIKTFNGRKGESHRPDNLVEGGDDITVADQRRFDYLERKGLATPLIKPQAKMQSAPSNKMESVPQNKAAQSGPLSSDGGRSGDTSGHASLSVPDRVQGPKTSHKRGGGRGL